MYIENNGVLPNIKYFKNGYTGMFFVRGIESNKLLTSTFADIGIPALAIATIYDRNNNVIAVMNDIVRSYMGDSYVNIIHVRNKMLVSWTCFMANDYITSLECIISGDSNFRLAVDYNKDNVILFFDNEKHVIENKPNF